MKRAIARFLAAADLKLMRHSTYGDQIEEFHLRSMLKEAELAGHRAAIDALVTYHTTPKGGGDQGLADYMRFCADHYQLSRSQGGQDLFVMYATALRQGGRYLEIGGANGVTNSNTIALRDALNWNGVLVEPDPEMFRVLARTRGHSDKVVNAAISPTGGTGTASFRRWGELSCLEGYEGKDQHYESRLRSESIVEVTTIDLTTLLQAEGPFDFFSLDVEGAELSILESIRWTDVVPPAVLTVEHNGRSQDIAALRRLLTSQGYSEVFPEHAWLTRMDLWMIHSRGLAGLGQR